MSVPLQRILLLCLCFFMATAGHASASVVTVLSDFQTLRVGDVVEIGVSIDTQGERINAAEIEVSYPADLLEFNSSDTTDSVVSVWLPDTHAVKEGLVTFSGITPGGFVSSRADFITLAFTVLKEGQGLVSIPTAVLLLHDGLGTSDSSTVQNMHINVEEGPSRINAHVDTDIESPEDFTVSSLTDADVFKGSPFLVFETTDKNSGIDHYTVSEGVFGKAYRAESPYELRTEVGKKTVAVTAYDKAGNTRVVTLYPHTLKAWYQNNIALGIIVVLCVLILFILRGVRRKWLLRV